MRRRLFLLALAAVLGAGLSQALPNRALAQAEIAGALARLKNNPRYQGRILGTHVKQDRGRILYEVRILRPDDRIILVYIDAETGGVVGDSERSRQAAPNGNDRPDRGRGNRGNDDRGRGNRGRER